MIQQLIMTDKTIEEEPIIHNHINTKIEALIARPTKNEIVRAPLEVYRFCMGIFKRQVEVQKFLLKLFIREFHLREPKKMMREAEEKKEEEVSQYTRVLLGCKDAVQPYPMQVIVNLAQLFLKCFLLGLSVKVGEPWRQVIMHKTRSLVKDLQVEFAIQGGSSFSQIIVEELQILASEFGCLQFYQGLLELFAKCDTFHIQQWIQKAMSKHRTQFEKTLLVREEPKTQNKENHTKKVIKKKRVTINVTDSTTQNHLCETPHSILKHQSQTIQSKKEILPSVSQLANKIRSSGGSSNFKSAPKLPRLYIHRSNKKAASQEETSAQIDLTSQPIFCHSPQQVKQNTSNLEKSIVLIPKTLQQDSPPSDSKVLCQQTPPRTIRRRLQ